MGYAVVHMQKFKAGGVYGIQSHNNREHPPRTNPDIHPERTDQNYHVISCDNYAGRIKQLITEQATETKTVRKDAVVYCSFIITSDHETMAAMSEWEQKLFFNAAAIWFAKRYGSVNIVNATVHMDETTPHMHIGVVPVKDNRLSAKALFDKKELTAIQTEFARDVGAQFGLARGKEGSERTHLSEARFKLETAKNDLERMERQKESLQSEIDPLLSLKVGIDEVEKPGKSIIPGTVTMKTSSYQQLLEQAKAYSANRDEIETLRERAADVAKREKDVARREASVEADEIYMFGKWDELNEEKNRQAHLNELLDRAEREKSRLNMENRYLKERLEKAQKDNESQIDQFINAMCDLCAEVLPEVLPSDIKSAKENLKQHIYAGLKKDVLRPLEVIHDRGEYGARRQAQALIEQYEQKAERWMIEKPIQKHEQPIQRQWLQRNSYDIDL